MSLIDLAEMFGVTQDMWNSPVTQEVCNDAEKQLNTILGPDYRKKCSERFKHLNICWPSRPNLDMYKSAEGVEVKLDIAGYSKDDLTISVEQNVLTVSGERKMDADSETEFYYRERTQTTFSRKITLPYNANPKTVKAQYENGTLTVYIPQPEISKLTPIKIE